MSDREWPPLRPVLTQVCQDCLDAKPSECHTPGCWYWMRDAPSQIDARVLTDHVVPDANKHEANSDRT